MTVVVGEKRFEVHGCVLMCGREFFRTQLLTGLGASSMRELTLPEMSARTFELIVECLYTGVLGSIDAMNVMELLEASKRLQVGVAEARCCEWLEEHLDASSALVVWESARRLGCEAVQAKAWPVVGRHLQEVARQELFLSLPQPLLVELLSDDSLVVHSEVAVYEAVMGWVRWDEAGRKGAIGEVLGAVRLGLLPAQYLAENVLTDPLMSNVNQVGSVSGSLVRRRKRQSPEGIGDLKHYHIEWSTRTYGLDSEHGGHDFKRSNVTGQLVFVEDPCKHHGASVVGSISITQYRMHYMNDYGISMIEVFDETQDAMEMYEAVLDDERDGYNYEMMQGDVQVVQRIEVDPAHRGHGLGLFVLLIYS